MILSGKSKWLLLAILPLLFAGVNTSAQGSFEVYEGKITSLQVDGIQGDSFRWKIYVDYKLTYEAPISAVEFKSGNLGSKIYVEWKKKGDYYFVVKADRLTGCTNLKVGKVRVIPILIKALAGQDKFIGQCNSVILDASASIGDIVSYKWSALEPYGIIGKSDEKITDFHISDFYTGSYPVTSKIKLVVTDKSGNQDSDTLKIIIDKPPVADIYISGKLEKDGSMIVDGKSSEGIALKYYWTTDQGNIIGDNHLSTVQVNGAGIYTLHVTDQYGCQSLKSFRFPLKSNILIANKDYGRTSWDKQIKIPILENDFDSDNDINPSSVQIKEKPVRGDVTVNPDGTVIYSNKLTKTGYDQFIYEVCDSLGSCDSALVLIDIFNAGLDIPEAFSPNGDGQNEFLIFRGLENYPQSRLFVFTRSGKNVYSNENYLNDWDGKIGTKKELLPTGTYYYVLELGGTTRKIKGFVYIDY